MPLTVADRLKGSTGVVVGVSLGHGLGLDQARRVQARDLPGTAEGRGTLVRLGRIGWILRLSSTLRASGGRDGFAPFPDGQARPRASCQSCTRRIALTVIADAESGAAATSDASTARRETTPSSDMTGEELLRTAAAGCGASIMLGPWKEADALKRDSICVL